MADLKRLAALPGGPQLSASELVCASCNRPLAGGLTFTATGGVDDGAWRYCAETDAWHKAADLPYLSGRAGVSLNDGTVVAFGGMDVAQGVAAYGSELLVRRGDAFGAIEAPDAPTGRCFPTLAAAPAPFANSAMWASTSRSSASLTNVG